MVVVLLVQHQFGGIMDKQEVVNTNCWMCKLPSASRILGLCLECYKKLANKVEKGRDK